MENASETNVYSEMSDLVRQAEEWAARKSALTPKQNVSTNQGSKLRSIEHRILKNAALLLFKQADIQNSKDFKNKFGQKLEKEVVRKCDSDYDIIVSPMNRTEFHSILKTGWGVENVSPIKDDEFQAFLNSEGMLGEPFPFSSKRRTSMLANLVPLSPIASDESLVPDKKAVHRSAPPVTRQLFQATSTPRRSLTTPLKRSNSVTPLKMETPKRAIGTPKMQVTPLAGEGPLENRASRLRRMKMEEKK